MPRKVTDNRKDTSLLQNMSIFCPLRFRDVFIVENPGLKFFLHCQIIRRYDNHLTIGQHDICTIIILSIDILSNISCSVIF
jgi:hypothetical protein